MKKILILLAVLAMAATPVMASTKLEASHPKKQALKHHVQTRHQKKQLTRRQKKQAAKKLAKRHARKHKAAV
jgi:Ni/Co efflux regulator RcnB